MPVGQLGVDLRRPTSSSGGATGSVDGGAAQPFAEHLGVAGRAQHAGDPAQLGAQPVGPRAVQQRVERAQVAAQPPAADPHLVHRGVALVGGRREPDQRVVREDPRRCRGAAPPSTTSPALGCVGQAVVGATRSGAAAAAGAERPDVLGGERALDRAGADAAPHPAGPAARGRPPCAPPRSRGTSMRTVLPSSTVTRVVGDLGQHLSVGVAHSYARRTVRTTAAGASGAPREQAVTSATRSVGRRAGAPGAGDLVPHARDVGRQLDRPGQRVAPAVAQRDTGPGQPQVGGVVVGGGQGHRLGRAERRPPAGSWSVRSGSRERVVRLVLAFLLQHARSAYVRPVSWPSRRRGAAGRPGGGSSGASNVDVRRIQVPSPAQLERGGVVGSSTPISTRPARRGRSGR